jgi:hypothetical protein
MSGVDQIRCRLCNKHALANCKWIKRKGWGKHNTSATHLASMRKQSLLNIEKQRVEAEQVLPAPEPSYLCLGGIYEDEPSTVITEQLCPQAEMTAGEEGMWETFETGDFSIELDDPEQEQRKRAAELERRVQEYDLWSSVEDHPESAGLQQDIELEIKAQTAHDAAIAEIIEGAGVYKPNLYLLSCVDNL